MHKKQKIQWLLQEGTPGWTSQQGSSSIFNVTQSMSYTLQQLHSHVRAMQQIPGFAGQLHETKAEGKTTSYGSKY